MKHSRARDPEAIEFARWPGRANWWCAFPVLTCSPNRSGFAKALRSGWENGCGSWELT